MFALRQPGERTAVDDDCDLSALDAGKGLQATDELTDGALPVTPPTRRPRADDVHGVDDKTAKGFGRRVHTVRVPTDVRSFNSISLMSPKCGGRTQSIHPASRLCCACKLP